MPNDTEALPATPAPSAWVGPLLAFASLPVLLTLVSTLIPWANAGAYAIGNLYLLAQVALFTLVALNIVVFACWWTARCARWNGVATFGLIVITALLSGTAILGYQNRVPYATEHAREDAINASLAQVTPALLEGNVDALRDGLASQASVMGAATFLCAVRNNIDARGVTGFDQAWPKDADAKEKVFNTAYEAAVSLPSISEKQRKAVLLIATNEALDSGDLVRLKDRLAAGPSLRDVNWQVDVQEQAPGIRCDVFHPWPLSSISYSPQGAMAGKLELLMAHGWRADANWAWWIANRRLLLSDAAVAVLAKSGAPLNEALRLAFKTTERDFKESLSERLDDDAEISRYVQALLDNGANPTVSDNAGPTAFEMLANARTRPRTADDLAQRRTALFDDLQRRLCRAAPPPLAGQRPLKECAA